MRVQTDAVQQRVLVEFWRGVDVVEVGTRLHPFSRLGQGDSWTAESVRAAGKGEEAMIDCGKLCRLSIREPISVG